MRKYELAIILDSDLKEEEKEKMVGEVKEEITKLKGKVGKVLPWGKKEFAYLLKKKKEGFYFIFNIELPSEGPVELGRKLRLKEKVLRYLLVRIEK